MKRLMLGWLKMYLVLQIVVLTRYRKREFNCWSTSCYLVSHFNKVTLGLVIFCNMHLQKMSENAISFQKSYDLGLHWELTVNPRDPFFVSNPLLFESMSRRRSTVSFLKCIDNELQLMISMMIWFAHRVSSPTSLEYETCVSCKKSKYLCDDVSRHTRKNNGLVTLAFIFHSFGFSKQPRCPVLRKHIIGQKCETEHNKNLNLHVDTSCDYSLQSNTWKI